MEAEADHRTSSLPLPPQNSCGSQSPWQTKGGSFVSSFMQYDPSTSASHSSSETQPRWHGDGVGDGDSTSGGSEGDGDAGTQKSRGSSSVWQTKGGSFVSSSRQYDPGMTASHSSSETQPRWHGDGVGDGDSTRGGKDGEAETSGQKSRGSSSVWQTKGGSLVSSFMQ